MLTSAERKSLKARAHKLEPVVQIGAKGLTDDVVAEIERALNAHELIKVRAGGRRPAGAGELAGEDRVRDLRRAKREVARLCRGGAALDPAPPGRGGEKAGLHRLRRHRARALPLPDELPAGGAAGLSQPRVG